MGLIILPRPDHNHAFIWIYGYISSSLPMKAIL